VLVQGNMHTFCNSGSCTQFPAIQAIQVPTRTQKINEDTFP
jgi:hypothetical protein